LNVSPSMVLRPSNLDVLVVCIKFLESFNNSKVNCELQNVMLDYSLFCFEKLHWSICRRIWVAFVVLYANPLPKCVALLFISCDWVLRNMEKQVDVPFQWKNFSPSFACGNFKYSHYYHESWSSNTSTYHKPLSKWFDGVKFHYNILTHIKGLDDSSWPW